jgi:Xaa-Pro aminopeptidase
MHSKNRERLFAAMEDGILILPAPEGLLRNRDTEYNFRQESSFWWLTGCEEPGAIGVFEKSGKKHRFTLFCLPKDANAELWMGIRMGPKGAKKQLGANEGFAIDEFPAKIEEFLKGHPRLYIPLDGKNACAGKVFSVLDGMKYKRVLPGAIPMEFFDSRDLLADVRLRKSDAEIALMREAAAVTASAFSEVFAVTKPGLREYQLRAVFSAVYGLHGADWAFETIAAAGENACTLHYVSCRDRLQDGDLILFDAGSEVSNYASDVSRTVPISGTFTKSQEEIYRIVLDAELAAIGAAKPGVTVSSIHDIASQVVLDGLMKLGLLKGKRETLLKKKAWRRWFPHGTSHWVGLDVHDVGTYADDKGERLLEPGMVLTVEPGLYFPANDRLVPKKYQGIGIRIEDDVLITEEGADVLTAAIPKEPRDLEKAMARRPVFMKSIAVPKS